MEAVKAIGLTLPHLALNLGNHIKCLCLLKKSSAVQNQDEKRRKEAEEFDVLYQSHWNMWVSAVCLRRMKLRALNKPVHLPLTSDLITLKQYLDSRIDNAVLDFQLSLQEWTAFAQVVICRLLIFNKRCVSEVEQLKYSDLTHSIDDETSDDLLQNMGVAEKALSKRMSVFSLK